MKKHRFIAMLLCICMIASTFPQVWAMDNEVIYEPSNDEMETPIEQEIIGDDIPAEPEEEVNVSPTSVSLLSTADYSGTCGDNATWELDTTGVLTISGNGDMYDYSSSTSAPWYSYRDIIETVLINNGIINIGSYAFYFCRSLTSITIPDSVTSIGDSAFFACSNLTDVDIPNSVTSIGGSAFHNCSSLTDINIPNGITSINNGTFYGCVNLTNIIIPNSVTSIGMVSFYECTSLTNLVIPGNVESINRSAFNRCTSLTDLTISNGVMNIGDDAFFSCTNLTSLVIPSSVVSIGNAAFAWCTKLTMINVNANNQYYTNDSYGVLYNKNMTILMQYPSGNTRTEFTVPNTVTLITRHAFAYSPLTNVTISSNVESISEYCFRYCSNLKNVTILGTINSIETGVFDGCNMLASITIPHSVTLIGSYAFADCSNLTSAYFMGNAPTTLNISAFRDTASTFTIYYIEGKSGWTIPTWTSPDGTVYNTATFAPSGNTLQTTFDTSEITLQIGETFDFVGLISTTSNQGLKNVQININKAEDESIGIIYHREESIGTVTYDLSNVSSLTAGATLTGVDQGGNQQTLELIAGTSWDIYVYATDNEDNALGDTVNRVKKRVNIIEPITTGTVYTISADKIKIEAGEPITFTVTASDDVTEVVFYADGINGLELTSEIRKDGKFTYERKEGFSQLGKRKIYAFPFINGQIIESGGKYIEIEVYTVSITKFEASSYYPIIGDNISFIIETTENCRGIALYANSIFLDNIIADDNKFTYTTFFNAKGAIEIIAYLLDENGNMIKPSKMSINIYVFDTNELEIKRVDGGLTYFDDDKRLTTKAKLYSPIVLGLNFDNIALNTIESIEWISSNPTNLKIVKWPGTITKCQFDPTNTIGTYEVSVIITNKDGKTIETNIRVEVVTTSFLLSDIHYNFRNSHSELGYIDQISSISCTTQAGHTSLAIYQLMYGDTDRAKFLFDNQGAWGGSCFGLTTTSILINQSDITNISLDSFNSTYKKISDLKIDDKSINIENISLINFIEAMHITQNDKTYSDIRNSTLNKHDEIITAVDNYVKNGTNPIEISIWGQITSSDTNGKEIKKNAGHTLFPYDITYNDNTTEVLVYDCNFPLNLNKKIIFTKSGNEHISWEYELWEGLIWTTGDKNAQIKYSTFATLNSLWQRRGTLNQSSKTAITAIANRETVITDIYQNFAIILNGEIISSTIYDLEIIEKTNVVIDDIYENDNKILIYLPAGTYTFTSDDLTEASMVNVNSSISFNSDTTVNEITLTVDDNNLNGNSISIDNSTQNNFVVNFNYTNDLAIDFDTLTLTGASNGNVVIEKISGGIQFSGIESGEIIVTVNNETITIEISENTDGKIIINDYKTNNNDKDKDKDKDNDKDKDDKNNNRNSTISFINIIIANNQTIITDDTTQTTETKYVCPYKDISGHWGEDIIKYISEYGLIDGITETQFKPDAPMTREVFFIAMARLAGITENHIDWAKSNGILMGYGNGEYGLQDTITREQMAVIFKRFLDKMEIDLTDYKTVTKKQFADHDTISSWAVDSVYEMQEIGLVKGKSNNLFDPLGNTTRAEGTTVLYNLIQTILEKIQ